MDVTSASTRVLRPRIESEHTIALKAGLAFRATLASAIRSAEISLIHSNGLWAPVNYWTTRLAREFHIPLVIQPHGMLEPWALQHKAWKKSAAMALFQRRDLESAVVLIATSPVEYENLRKLRFVQPIATIPNGVHLGKPEQAGRNLSGAKSGIRTVLYLSRVHPVKGLLNLIYAWSRLALKDWRLVIAGPNEGNHLQEVMGLIRRMGVESTVEYVGEVDGESKTALYRSADLFVLPTFTENFGLVVAEALAHGVPVITTRGAPWSDLEVHRCGWWVEVGVEPLVNALREASSLGITELREMGARGRQYVRRYDWDHIAEQMADVYRWALGVGPMPACVRLN